MWPRRLGERCLEKDKMRDDDMNAVGVEERTRGMRCEPDDRICVDDIGER